MTFRRPLHAFLLCILLSHTTPCAAQPAAPKPACAETATALPEQIHHQAANADQYRAAHQFATGLGVTVGIIDTGVAPHPRLPPVKDGGDLVDDTSGTMDCDAHGTIVAGIIAARDTGDGIVGVAPDVALVSIRQTSTKSRKTNTPGGTLATLTTAINTALDKNVQVINVSVVSCLPPGTLPPDTQAFDAALQRAETQGVIIVAAAGNLSTHCQQGSIVYPAHHGTVIGVTATEDSYHPTDYSLISPKPTVSAPGLVHAALSPNGPGIINGTMQNQTVTPFIGTSFAAPVVTGTVALLRQRHPTATAAQIREMLFASVDPSNGTVDINRTVRYVAESPPPVHTPPVPTQAKTHTAAVPRAMWVLGVLVLVVICLIGVRGRRKAAAT
ncbi:MAG: type VII secretion-associated serine protease mycosin [Corynebacterium sp.]|nr:type VII secretion-associated serine protease mycosin [Corynebacterium sp.]